MLLTTTDHDFQRLAAAVDHLTALIRLSLRLEIKDMTILDDIQAAEDKLNDKLNSIASEHRPPMLIRRWTRRRRRLDEIIVPASGEDVQSGFPSV